MGLTLQITGSGLAFSMLIGLPIGVALGLSKRIPAAGCLMPVIYTGMGLPPVVAGLIVFLILSNQRTAGQPALVVYTYCHDRRSDHHCPTVGGGLIPDSRALSRPHAAFAGCAHLGATKRFQMAWTILMEARGGLFAAIVAAFGSIISEVGAVMLVGGNIERETRVLTTAIVLETRKGNFALALALGLILLGLAFMANYLMYQYSNGERNHEPAYLPAAEFTANL